VVHSRKDLGVNVADGVDAADKLCGHFCRVCDQRSDGSSPEATFTHLFLWICSFCYSINRYERYSTWAMHLGVQIVDVDSADGPNKVADCSGRHG
jgi:hypothetical protein